MPRRKPKPPEGKQGQRYIDRHMVGKKITYTTGTTTYWIESGTDYLMPAISSEGEIWTIPKPKPKVKSPLTTTRRKSKYDIDFITPAQIHLKFLLDDLADNRTPVRITKAQEVVNRYIKYGHLTKKAGVHWMVRMEG